MWIARVLLHRIYSVLYYWIVSSILINFNPQTFIVTLKSYSVACLEDRPCPDFPNDKYFVVDTMPYTLLVTSLWYIYYLLHHCLFSVSWRNIILFPYGITHSTIFSVLSWNTFRRKCRWYKTSPTLSCSYWNHTDNFLLLGLSPTLFS
jgi:hypothetical protein